MMNDTKLGNNSLPDKEMIESIIKHPDCYRIVVYDDMIIAQDIETKKEVYISYESEKVFITEILLMLGCDEVYNAVKINNFFKKQ